MVDSIVFFFFDNDFHYKKKIPTLVTSIKASEFIGCNSSQSEFHFQFYASCLISGNRIQVNIEEAIKYFKKATDAGDSKSMFYYATLLYKFDESRKKEAIEYS